ncbi:uncharacterized protein LOC135441177 [Drosophila montana]|uniref:uncharacterized protein LOC135441177 n=1 Tax=Drosophila montana TaxID=40370 RepID=UPI00313AAF67
MQDQRHKLDYCGFISGSSTSSSHGFPERLSTDKPFCYVGVDFCGPVNTYLRIRGKGPTKSNIAIFVCMAVKAVHIEIVSDLSTNKFLESLKRMIARRGPVSLLELKKFMFNTSTQDANLSYCSSEEITIHFNPHFAGLWEATVKSAKGLLVRSLANTRFTFEELNTAVVEIEADTLNGDAPRALPEREIITNDISNLDCYERITAVKQPFLRRWSAEYVNELRAWTKWTSVSANLTNDTSTSTPMPTNSEGPLHSPHCEGACRIQETIAPAESTIA